VSHAGSYAPPHMQTWSNRTRASAATNEENTILESVR
jgi:hypothetical protein